MSLDSRSRSLSASLEKVTIRSDRPSQSTSSQRRSSASSTPTVFPTWTFPASIASGCRPVPEKKPISKVLSDPSRDCPAPGEPGKRVGVAGLIVGNLNQHVTLRGVPVIVLAVGRDRVGPAVSPTGALAAQLQVVRSVEDPVGGGVAVAGPVDRLVAGDGERARQRGIAGVLDGENQILVHEPVIGRPQTCPWPPRTRRPGGSASTPRSSARTTAVVPAASVPVQVRSIRSRTLPTGSCRARPRRRTRRPDRGRTRRSRSAVPVAAGSVGSVQPTSRSAGQTTGGGRDVAAEVGVAVVERVVVAAAGAVVGPHGVQRALAVGDSVVLADARGAGRRAGRRAAGLVAHRVAAAEPAGGGDARIEPAVVEVHLGRPGHAAVRAERPIRSSSKTPSPSASDSARLS